MPWFLAAGGVLALEAFRFVRACFRIRWSPAVKPQLVCTTLFPCSRLWTSILVHATGGIESGTSIYVRALSSCASVRVPLTDTLDNFPRYARHIRGTPCKLVAVRTEKVDEHGLVFGVEVGTNRQHLAIRVVGVERDLLCAFCGLKATCMALWL